ncbi:MAG: helix-turn-helix domain-containing protein [Candidatus Thermoplasmatota archaeon]|nr:helix-turn-helix domain-containing protein [Candidatus Thermoplasmatota archaeon]
MMEVLLNIKIPDNWVSELSQRLPSPLRFVECMPYGESGGRGLVEIRADGDGTDELLKSLKEYPGVCKVDFSPVQDGVVLGSVTLQKCVACQVLTGSDCFLLSAHSDVAGGVEWKLITGGEGSLSELVKKLEETGCQVELKKVTKISRKNLLTDRQEQIIRVALEKGYYDCPKKTSIKDLASLFGISHSTLAEILQKGEKKIIQQHFR